MCRLLGVVSTSSQPLADVLRDDLEQFTALSCDHCDGWGLGYADEGGGYTVRKQPETAQSSAAYRAALEEARTDAAVLHLRKASPGMINTPLNTHPFTDGRVVFAHNGWCADTGALDAELARAGGPSCQGTTDSERYFGLVVAALRSVAPEVALTGVSHRINALTRTEALNCLLLTDEALYAFSSFDASRPTCSGKDPVATYTMGYRIGPEGVVVASTGWEDPALPWEPLTNGRVLRVGRRDLHTSVHRMVPSWAEERIAAEEQMAPSAAV